MNALLHRLHNFILPLLRGEDRVCRCTCGSHRAYHVVPYHGALSTADFMENYFGSHVITQQEMDVIAGLLFGLCVSWFLLWLDGFLHSALRFWRTNPLNNDRFWSWSNSRNSRKPHPKHTEDSGGNMAHFSQDKGPDTFDSKNVD